MLEDFSKHQQGIIKRYYKHQDAIKLQRLAELVSDLYLAEGKKRERVWNSIIKAMQVLDVPPQRIRHLREKDDAALIARLVKEIEAKME